MEPSERGRDSGDSVHTAQEAQQNQYDLTLLAMSYNTAAWMQGSRGHLLQSSGKAFYQIHSGKWYKLLDFFSNIKNSHFEPLEAG